MNSLPQLCEGGDLDKLINKRKKTNDYFPEADIWRTFSQIIEALNYCHDPEQRADDNFPLPIIHRDLKPENSTSSKPVSARWVLITALLLSTVFLNKDQTQVRIGDFGFARELDDRKDAYSNVGVSPRITDRSPYMR